LQASVRQKQRIGERSIIGMSSVVIEDVLENAVAAGNPAKIIKIEKGKKYSNKGREFVPVW